MNVLALWGMLLGTGFFAIGALVRLEFVALLISPMLGIGVALLLYVASIPIAHFMSHRIVSTSDRHPELPQVQSEISTSLIEDLLVMLSSSPTKQKRRKTRVEGEVAGDRRSSGDGKETDDPVIRNDDRDVDAIVKEPKRSYVCRHCDGVTRVRGEEFARVANPFTFVMQTYCANCEQYLALHEFFWKNTKENLADFRKRMRKKTPLNVRLVAQLATPLGGFVTSYLLSLLMFNDWPWNLLFGLIGGLFAGAYLPPIVTQWMGMDYRKKR